MKVVRSAAAAVAALAILVVGSAVLEAHMKLEKSEPAAAAVIAAPPATVQVFFSEEPDLKVSDLEIKGPGKVTLASLEAVEKSLKASVRGEVADGAYTVSWRAAGKDGHIQKGEFSFTVKRK